MGLPGFVFAAESAEVAAGTGGWFIHNAWLIPLIPAISFVLILFIGKRTPGKGATIGIAAVAVSAVLSIGTAVQWVQHVNDAGSHAETTTEHALAVDEHGGIQLAAAEGEAAEGAGAEAGEEHAAVAPFHRSVTWFELEGHEIKAGTLIDGLAVMMLVVVTVISLLVHIYSTDYVSGDRRYTHFFAFLSLFTASMLTLVIADNTLMLLCSWELVGLCSFALIGHWWEEKPNSDAALKAFITNRVGDMGLIIGVSILYFAADRSFDILQINTMANAGEIRHLLLLVASCSLIAAVMSKSGQFFLHTWLPDAMAGPTPVSALIHAATMVVAGVFMVARLYGVFFNGLTIAGSSINLLALVGGVTVIAGAGLAFVQTDIKKVLAYSTISQLGYMVMALGVGAWTAAVFHLFTHAFFKACLFLGSGSVSHAVHSFDMKADMGGLKKYMPKTFWTFLVSSAALAGIFPLAGFWSKDEILAGTGGWPETDGNGTYYAMLVMGMVGAAMTAAYMTRVIYLTFFGEYRGHGHPHESGPRITVPLMILAALAVVAGFVNLPEDFLGLSEDWTLRFEHYVEPVGAYFPAISHANASLSLAIVSTVIALGGVAWAYAYYFGGVTKRSRAARRQLTEIPNGITTTWGPARALYAFLANKYYLDKLYTDLIVGSIKGPIARAAYWVNQNVIDRIVDTVGTTSVKTGEGVYRYIDQLGIDGVVNGTGLLSEQSGEELRQIQTGKVQQYAALFFGGATVLAGIFILVVAA
ncbi:MAG TPA: NADH-quinone oxidoreductase subunit L [Acidimicrobiales bacterium]